MLNDELADLAIFAAVAGEQPLELPRNPTRTFGTEIKGRPLSASRRD